MGAIADLGKSIISFQFYRTAAKYGFGRVLFHVILIVLLYSISFTVFANKNVLSEMNAFLDWAGQNFPTLYIKGKEMSTDAQEPFFASYREGFVNFVFSTEQPYTDLNSLQANTILFEKERLVYIATEGFQESYDLEALEEIPEDMTLTVDTGVLGKIKEVLGKYFSPVIFLFTFLFSILGYLVSALLYSIIALILNAIVGTQVRYGGLYAISVYSLTFLNLFVIASLFLPFLIFPFRFVLLVGATLVYMTAGIMANKTEAVSG